jgi:soluble lytic murein transglycosylase
MTCKSRIHSRLLVSGAAVCLVVGPALAGIPSPTARQLLPPSKDEAQATRPSAASNRPQATPVRVAASDLEAFGIVIPEVIPPGDTDYLPRILADYRNGDVEEADILKSKLKAPAALAVAEWAAIRSGTSLSFNRIVAFQRDYKDWPISTLLQRRAEEAFLRARKPSAEVRQYFKDRPPITGSGRIALAFALKADGQEAQAIDLVRRIWREDSFGPDTEERIREEFPTALSLADHRFRMERFLFRESWGAALRAAGYAGKDYATLVKARMGAFEGKKKAEKTFAAVPAALRSDSSYIFSRALFLRRQGKLIDAAQLMAKAPRDPNVLVDGDDWWDERRLIARKLLDDGKYEEAYQVASLHGAEGAAERIEAEFHAGWIALRFLHRPEQAAKHFAEAANIAATPISVARAAYWQGRALEAAGAAGEARRHYQRAADKPTTY